MSTTQETGSSKSVFQHVMMNPMVRKLDKVQERDEVHSSTYGGIVAKCIFFLALCGVGVGLYFFVHEAFKSSAFLMFNDYSFSIQEMGIALGALLLGVLSPILIWLIRPLIPFFGSLYCLCQGFVIAWLCSTYGGEYREAAWLAVGLTAIIVIVMLFLYVSGIVRVNKKFRSIITTLFISAIISGLVLFIIGFIPALKPIYSFFTQNFAVSVIGGIIFIIIAALFLLVDFDCIKHTVEDKLPKKYEWVAAMALVFTIIWLYLKIFNLIIKLTSASNRS